MLRLQPDAPENGATGGSDAYFNTFVHNFPNRLAIRY